MSPRIVSVIMAGALMIGLVGMTSASGGSAYVTSSCSYPSLQDNSIDQYSAVYVWIKVTGSNTSVGEWSTVDNAGQNYLEGALIGAGCTRDDGKYVLYWAEDANTATLGSYTLTAWQGEAGDSTKISGDGYKIVEVVA